MKKILTVVLALVLVCGLAVTAVAAGFGVETDKDIIEAGEEVTVTVTLDETITADQGATALSGKLTYDKSAVTLVAGSAKASDAYSFVTVTESKKAPEVKMAWFSVTSTAIELPAGTIMTVSFTANKELAAAAVEAAFNLALEAQTALGESVVKTEVAASITVCLGHAWTETGRTGDCEHDGEITYSCDICGATKTEAYTAEGHVQAEWASDYLEEVDEEGMPLNYTLVYCCEYCGIEMSRETFWYLFASSLPCTTPELAPGETISYQTFGLGGFELNIAGNDASVNLVVDSWPFPTNETYAPVDGVVSIDVPEDRYTPVYIKITNTGSEVATFDLSMIIPEGHYENPVLLQPGVNTVELEENSDMGYYYTFEAPCVGTLTITASGEWWHMDASNMGCDLENWEDDWYSDSLSYSNPDFGDTIVMPVKPGDIIEIHVWNEDEDWNVPAAAITVNAVFQYTHEGHIVHVEAVEPGCENEGNIEYWYCDCCKMFWQDEALTQLTNSHNVILPITHKNIVHVDAVKPGCETEGNIEHWYCADCNMVWIDEALLQISNHQSVKLGATHWNIVHVEAVEPGCETEGNIEHWYCADCNIVWIDEALLQISNHQSVKLGACHKNIIHMEAVAPGCHFKGHVEHWYCADCDMLWIDEAMLQISNHMSVILPELGGDVIHVEAKAPTCTEDGNIEHWYCEHCEQVWQDEARTQLTNHKNVIVGATGHVYGEDGVCTTCGDNPKAGDTTISLVVAAAVISAMSIVALPLVKKHF